MWQLTPGQNLRFRQFDDEFVLFNNLSGDTHLLGASAMQMLAQLQGGACSADCLLDALAAKLECARDSVFDGDVSTVLAQLATLSLIRPA